MEECIFCKIVKGEVPSAKIWEDEHYLAVLDSEPNTKGQVILMTREHYPSYIFDMPKTAYKYFMATAKKVGKLLEKGSKAERVAMVMEGMSVNHAHVKLYPLHGLKKKDVQVPAPAKTIEFDKYEGYISTMPGPEKTVDELNKIASGIKK